MPKFTMVVDEVNPEQFAHVIRIQTASHEKLKWTPQGGAINNVTCPAFTSAMVVKKGYIPPLLAPGKPVPTLPTEMAYRSLRLDWEDEGIACLEEVLAVFKPGHHAEERKAG